MLPEIWLMGDVDVAALSQLLRGMIVTISYADTHDGIGLTATGALNRKFVHWAAVHFDWPSYTSARSIRHSQGSQRSRYAAALGRPRHAQALVASAAAK